VSHVPPIEPSDSPREERPRRNERPRPSYGEYAPPAAAPSVPPTSDVPESPTSKIEATPFAASNFSQSDPAFHNPPPANPKGLGVVALIVAAVALVFSVVLSVFSGLAFAPLASQAISPGGTIDQSALDPNDPGVGVFGMLGMVFFFGGSALGIWALVQGILATVKKRGRGFGITAIALAVATPVICFVLFYVVAFASAPELLGISG
jgi:hypothetical protein